MNSATTNFNICFFHHQLARIPPTVDLKRTQLQLAKSYFVEAQRMYTKILGSTHPETIDTTSHLTDVLNDLSLM